MKLKSEFGWPHKNPISISGAVAYNLMEANDREEAIATAFGELIELLHSKGILTTKELLDNFAGGFVADVD